MHRFRKIGLRRRLALAGVLACSLHAPAMAKAAAANKPGTSAPAADHRPHGRALRQVGPASWYGKRLDGQRTASGEVFDARDFTGAHPSLPFGTVVKVTNLRNGRSAQVRINDRGPFTGGRIIDVSSAAASALGMLGHGIARVRLDVLSAGAVAGVLGGDR